MKKFFMVFLILSFAFSSLTYTQSFGGKKKAGKPKVAKVKAPKKTVAKPKKKVLFQK
jgi:hypothetical protein